jgi:hypothetical protein
MSALFDNDAWPWDALEGYRLESDWEREAATEPQLEALRRRGWNPPSYLRKGQAHFVLGLPTPKQRRVLEHRGRWRDGLTFDEARELLDAIAAHEGWGR